MSEIVIKPKKLYCSICRAPLGAVGGKEPWTELYCSRCKSSYDIRMREDDMVLKIVQAMKHSDPEPA